MQRSDSIAVGGLCYLLNAAYHSDNCWNAEVVALVDGFTSFGDAAQARWPCIFAMML